MIDREEVERVANELTKWWNARPIDNEAAALLRSLLERAENSAKLAEINRLISERDDLQKKLDTCLQGGMRVWAERAEKAEAERDELKETQLKFGTMMHEVMAERDEAFVKIAQLVDQCRAVDQLRVEANALWAEELDKAIKHCEAMESWTTYEEWGRAADAFRKWMEERGK